MTCNVVRWLVPVPVLFGFLVPFSGCGTGGKSSVTIQIPELPQLDSKMTVLDSFRGMAGANTGPAAISSFDCLMVNVMGAGIGAWEDNAATVTGTPGCGYLGVYSRVFSPTTGATITLDVDNGTGRIVQVLGIKKSGGCNVTPSSTEFDSTVTYLGAFELGRQTVDVNGVTTVAISNAYNPGTASDARCYLGGTFPDVAEPTISSGTITTSNATSSSIDLSWSAAADNDAGGTLYYKVVRASSTASIDTITEADAITSGANLVTNWDAGVTNLTASGLSASTTYAFSVLVRDGAGNMALYTPATAATTAGGGGGGGGGTFTVSLDTSSANYTAACPPTGGGNKYEVSPTGSQTVSSGSAVVYTVSNCAGNSAPTLSAAHSCPAGTIAVTGNSKVFTYTATITSNCTVAFN